MSATPRIPQRVVLIGAGRVGTAVAQLLQTAGSSIVGVTSRTSASATVAAERLGAPGFNLAAPPEADAYLIGATDRGISEIAASLNARVPDGSTLVHFSGSLGVEALEPAVGDRVFGAALHPVQACPDLDTAIARLPGSAWGVTCSPGRLEWGFDFVRAAGGMPVEVAPSKRALWHAASVMTSNGLSALLASGEAILAATGHADPGPILGPLAAGSIANALEGGGGAATLTGPIVRGEVDAIRRHLEAIDSGAPELRAAYLAVGLTILEVAKRTGRLEGTAAAEIEEVLGG